MPDPHETTPTPAVSTPSAEPTTPAVEEDRPIQNAVAEFNRKFGKMQQQIESLTNFVMTQQQPRPAAPTAPTGPTDPTDDQLWTAAQQGDRQAFELYQQRIADRRIRGHLAAQNQAALIQTQLDAIVKEYPVLNDPTHPLSQTVGQAYQLLLSRGYPQGADTMLRAATMAITDRKDLVLAMSDQTGIAERPRQAATRPGAQIPSTVRHTTPAPAPPHLTPEERALAQRIGVKDPEKAKERWAKRYAAGQSQLGNVGSYLESETE